MPLVSALGQGGAVWLFSLFLLAVFGKGVGRKAAFLGTIALAISFVVSDEVLKGLIGRPRPFLYFTDVRLLVAAPQQFSFPSGHASTAFAPATAVFIKHRTAGGFALAFAALIGFSRIYVGVHYPLDVLGGMILGIGVGWLVVSQEAFLDIAVVKAKGILTRVKKNN